LFTKAGLDWPWWGCSGRYDGQWAAWVTFVDVTPARRRIKEALYAADSEIPFPGRVAQHRHSVAAELAPAWSPPLPEPAHVGRLRCPEEALRQAQCGPTVRAAW
jgi:hypothetical protein